MTDQDPMNYMHAKLGVQIGFNLESGALIAYAYMHASIYMCHMWV